MTKYKLKAGWTKARMLKVLKTRNNGTRAATAGGTCLYETYDGNHCAVGCFIPEGAKEALLLRGTADELFGKFPRLKRAMPLDVEGMQALQKVHDRFNSKYADEEDYASTKGAKSLHEAFEIFVRESVTQPRKKVS